MAMLRMDYKGAHWFMVGSEANLPPRMEPCRLKQAAKTGLTPTFGQLKKREKNTIFSMLF